MSRALPLSLPVRGAPRATSRRPVAAVVALAALLGGSSLVTGLPAAQAVQPRQTTMAAAAPQEGTPQISDGAVYAMAQVGGTMVVGGSFTQTASANPDAPLSTPFVLAFDAVTGAVQTGFAPRLDGVVQTLLPGPVPGTVYVGGLFKTAGGAPARGLVLLNVADGSQVTSFKAASFDLANVQTVKRLGNRLFVGGTFTKVAGVPHGGIATLDATTGALDPYMGSSVSENHNWTPASPTGDAKAPVGVYKLDISPDGSKLVAIGNFRVVDGASHDQMLLWDLGPSAATVRNWSTDRLAARCSAGAYDSYVRDVDFSPDGSYFVLGATGGYGTADAVCDTVTRWESSATGTGIQPTWLNYTGKDTILSVAATDNAVYAGGHQRWLNNGLGADNAGPGAVPRPGIAALDPVNGIPLAWNPGRNPRGAGAWALYATPAGLWVGSDTNYIGNYRYLRSKIAFFPLSGVAAASKSVATLPARVWSGSTPAGSSTVLARVNVGGPALQSLDSGPDWSADTATSTTVRAAGSNITTYGSTVPTVDATVPASTPRALFDSERWDPGSRGDGQEMQFRIPVAAGTPVQVRVYFANRCGCTPTAGTRRFDIVLDGVVKSAGFDIVAAAGNNTATMRSFDITSDGSVDLALAHLVENPVVSGVEVVATGTTAPTAATGSFTTRTFDGTTAGSAVAASVPLDPATVRGATLVGGTLFYGRTDGNLYSRSLVRGQWGAETLVDPYNDPAWATVNNGSGGVYRGTRSGFYDQITNLTSMAYDGSGQLYYTLYGQSGLFRRAFSPDSGILSWQQVQVPGVSLPDVTGMFLSGSSLYYVTRADGNLNVVGFSPTTGLTGTPTVVSGPAKGGIDWRSRVLFLGPAAQGPTASAVLSCDALRCTADGGASTDPDGTIRTYAWSWGDGTTSTGAAAAHDYAAAGTYTATLTVTDDAGLSATWTRQTTVVAQARAKVAFRAASSWGSASATTMQVPVPAGVQAGDALLLKVSTTSTASAPTPPAGWTEVSRSVFAAASSLTVLWSRVATTADTAGGTVPVQLAAPIKSQAQLLAYSGTAGTPVAVAAADTALVTGHATPGAQVTAAGSAVVSFWTDKSSTTTGWTAPDGVTSRGQVLGTGTGYLTSLVADEVVVLPGTAPARTATTDATSRAAMTTVVLAPVP